MLMVMSRLMLVMSMLIRLTLLLLMAMMVAAAPPPPTTTETERNPWWDYENNDWLFPEPPRPKPSPPTLIPQGVPAQPKPQPPTPTTQPTQSTAQSTPTPTAPPAKPKQPTPAPAQQAEPKQPAMPKRATAPRPEPTDERREAARRNLNGLADRFAAHIYLARGGGYCRSFHDERDMVRASMRALDAGCPLCLGNTFDEQGTNQYQIRFKCHCQALRRGGSFLVLVFRCQTHLYGR